jgi:nitroimidazol reductase NimA-like FMN-containing flavoprotein (pyridoxamine 5'-phosphate oxidase superfamily)
MPKNLNEVQRFMGTENLASFATVGSDGEPHVVPVFFTYENQRVYVQTDRKSVKVRNLQKNNKVAVAVYRGEEAVILRGKARIIEDHEEFTKRTQDHIAKYRLKLDKNGKDSMGIPLFDKTIRCVVEVTSKRIIFW